jgi:hypothetical protein
MPQFTDHYKVTWKETQREVISAKTPAAVAFN